MKMVGIFPFLFAQAAFGLTGAEFQKLHRELQPSAKAIEAAIGKSLELLKKSSTTYPT
jgi:hypothetical protein